MQKSVSHYYNRISELGFLGTIQRIWLRSINSLTRIYRSIWWGWKARHEMSEAAFLAHTTGQWHTIDALLEHLADRPVSTFLFPHESLRKTTEILNQYFPKHITSVIETAEAICRNELTILGQSFHFPDGIDWQSDPLTGWKWPALHISRMEEYIWSPLRPADIRYTWEINRHQHLLHLGIAFWLTGEKRYVEAFNTQIQNWIKTNPVQHGINWYSSLEVSLRLLSWIAAFQFFRNSPEFSRKTGAIFLKSLWQQADFLSKHLQTTSTNDFPNNHIIGECVGLVLVGSTFPEFRDASKWLSAGIKLLDQQITVQTHPDGVNKEQATGYHRFVAEFLLLIVTRSRQGTLPPDSTVENSLERMIEYIFFTLTPESKSPMWGDADYGRVLGFGQNKDFWDFRPILSSGALIFQRPDWKCAAGQIDEDSFWLLGPDSIYQWDQLNCIIPPIISKAFPDAGIYIIRDEWSTDTDVAFFRCGPFGLGDEGNCAHSHCDLLSFVLWINGKPLLVDSGSYSYHGPWRDLFRLSKAHNTVIVDGLDQATPIPYFNWRTISTAKCIKWTEKQVTGVLSSQNHVDIYRKLWHPNPGDWRLVDIFKGQAEHLLEWYFHFAPGLDFQSHEELHSLTILRNNEPFVIFHLPENVLVSQMDDSWYSNQYNVKEKNIGLYGKWQGMLGSEGTSFQWQFQRINN